MKGQAMLFTLMFYVEHFSFSTILAWEEQPDSLFEEYGKRD